MPKHGTASVSGLFVELVKAVMGALPRNLPNDVVEGWTKNGEALKRALQQALMPPPGECVVMSALDVAIAGIVRTLQQFFYKKELFGLSIQEFSYKVHSEELTSGGRRRVWIHLTVSGWWDGSHHIAFRLDENECGVWLLSDPVSILLNPKMQMAGVVHLKINDIELASSVHRFVEKDPDALQMLKHIDSAFYTNYKHQ